MGIMGIMNRASGMQIIDCGFHVRMMFLFLGVLLSIVNLPIVSGQNGSPLMSVPPIPHGLPGQRPIAPAPSAENEKPPPPATALDSPDSPASAPVSTGPPPPNLTPDSPNPSPTPSAPAITGSPPPPPPTNTTSTTSDKPVGDTWNESEKAGVVIASIAALLQVAVVAFLLIKRHQMLTTVEYDDIDDLEYETPPDSNFRDIESA